MAKLPAKFSAQQILEAGGWPLEELIGEKKISTTSPSKDRKISARKTGIPVTGLKRPTTYADRKAILKKTAQKPIEQPSTPKTRPNDGTGQTSGQAEVSEREVESDAVPELTAEAADAASQIETLLATGEDLSDQNEPEQPAAVEQRGDANDGYAEGFKKGETEGFVKGEQAGYEAGLEAGTKAGREAAEKAFSEEIATQRGVLNDLIQALTNQQDASAEYEQALLPLIVQLTQVVLMGELKTQPEHIQRLVQQALAVLPHNAQSARAFVNPSDLEWLQASVKPEIELVADASLARGGCRIETADSKIDASLAARVREALVNTWGNEEEIAPVSELELQQIESALDS